MLPADNIGDRCATVDNAVTETVVLAPVPKQSCHFCRQQMFVVCTRRWKRFCQTWYPETVGTLSQCRVLAALLVWAGWAIMVQVRQLHLDFTRQSGWSYMHWTRPVFTRLLSVRFLSIPACSQVSRRGIWLVVHFLLLHCSSNAFWATPYPYTMLPCEWLGSRMLDLGTEGPGSNRSRDAVG